MGRTEQSQSVRIICFASFVLIFPPPLPHHQIEGEKGVLMQDRLGSKGTNRLVFYAAVGVGIWTFSNLVLLATGNAQKKTRRS